MPRLLSLLFLFLALHAIAAPQRTTRRGRAQAAPAEVLRPAAPSCSLISAPPGAVTLSGYDKTLASSLESLFITSNLDSATLSRLVITVDYLDTSGRQLHRRTLSLSCAIPPRQTRRIDIPSWDRQHVYFYRASEPRRRVHAAASPFDITLRLDSIALSK